jgi:tetratricopeptide (TPR) repeat protein
MALTMGETLAQSVNKSVPVNATCVELAQAVMTQVANGGLNEAELAVFSALAAGGDHVLNSCAGLVLNNAAVSMSVSGRYADAERLAERAVLILEKTYSPNDLVLLRPLQTLAASRFEQGKTAKARDAFKRVQAIRTQRPEDAALVHGIAATLLHAAGKLAEAETEYLASLRAWEDAGRGEMTDAGAIFNGLGVVYIQEQRLTEARQALDRALDIFRNAKDAAPFDRLKVLHCRGALYARQGAWREAEQDFHDALAIADREPWVDPVALRSLLSDYAYVLRRNHHAPEARSMEARAAGIHLDPSPTIDVVDLLTKVKPDKK